MAVSTRTLRLYLLQHTWADGLHYAAVPFKCMVSKGKLGFHVGQISKGDKTIFLEHSRNHSPYKCFRILSTSVQLFAPNQDSSDKSLKHKLSLLN